MFGLGLTSVPPIVLIGITRQDVEGSTIAKRYTLLVLVYALSFVKLESNVELLRVLKTELLVRFGAN